MAQSACGMAGNPLNWAEMIESEIKSMLIELQTAIESTDAATIRQQIAFIDDSLKNHRKDLDSQLAHYLRNRSYQKALAYLNGEADIPKGRCSGRTDFA